MSNFKKMVEVKGIGFPNKGADLLLSAINSRLIVEGFDICLEPYGNFSHRAKYGAWTKLRIGVKGFNILWLLNLAPKYVCDRMGWVKARDVNFVIDASGYAYGDPWSFDLANNRILLEVNKFPTIFLPQTFGPFENSRSKKVAQKISKFAKIVFARENRSSKEFLDATGRKLEVIPDITFAYKPKDLRKEIFDGCILIPNFQVLDRMGDAYISLLLECAVKMREKFGCKIMIMNHEGAKDLKICEKVLGLLEKKYPDAGFIYSAKSGDDAKINISGAKMVVTSRYHGLVSALSSCVPCIPIGWSYKYDEAFEMFGMGNFSKEIAINPEYAIKLIDDDKFFDYFSSNDYHERLRSIVGKVNDMWDSIISFMKKSN